jgi:hypothetical protein
MKLKLILSRWLAYPYITPTQIGLENWSSKSSTASNPLYPTNQIDRIQSSQTTAPPWRSKINPVQKDHCVVSSRVVSPTVVSKSDSGQHYGWESWSDLLVNISVRQEQGAGARTTAKSPPQRVCLGLTLVLSAMNYGCCELNADSS